MSGDDLLELELPRFLASDPVRIPKERTLRIVKVVPKPGKDDEVQYKVLAEAKIPERIQQALIILIPLPEPDGDRLFQAGVKDLAGFKGGDRMFINLSKTDIRVRIGEKAVSVPAGRSETFVAGKLPKPTNAPILYSFFTPREENGRFSADPRSS